MPEMIGIEKDVEDATVLQIAARLAAVPLTGVRVVSFLGGGLGEETERPYVFVACSPAQAVKKGHLYEAELAVEVSTAHLTGRDRDGTALAELMGHVAAALDYDDFSQHAVVVNSIQLVREGGSYEVAQSSNDATLSVKVMACGDGS